MQSRPTRRLREEVGQLDDWAYWISGGWCIGAQRVRPKCELSMPVPPRIPAGVRVGSRSQNPLPISWALGGAFHDPPAGALGPARIQQEVVSNEEAMLSD